MHNCQIEYVSSDSDIGELCGKPSVTKCADCGAAKLAEQGWRTTLDMWAFKNFLLWAWKLLLLAVVVFPLVLYGLCRGAAAVSVWVWRGFRANPAG
jgi:hypothetical protein